MDQPTTDWTKDVADVERSATELVAALKKAEWQLKGLLVALMIGLGILTAIVSMQRGQLQEIEQRLDRIERSPRIVEVVRTSM